MLHGIMTALGLLGMMTEFKVEANNIFLLSFFLCRGCIVVNYGRDDVYLLPT